VAKKNNIISRVLRSRGSSGALVFALPAVLFAAAQQPLTGDNAVKCQTIVAEEAAQSATTRHNRLTDLARARIVNICASSGALVVESLRHRSGTGDKTTIAALTGSYLQPGAWRD